MTQESISTDGRQTSLDTLTSPRLIRRLTVILQIFLALPSQRIASCLALFASVRTSKVRIQRLSPLPSEFLEDVAAFEAKRPAMGSDSRSALLRSSVERWCD
jgi:hypothetical protein